MAAVKFSQGARRLADGFTARAGRFLAALLRRLWVVSPLRAGAESALLMTLLLALVLSPMKSAPNMVIPATFLLFTLLCGSWAGLRMRLTPGTWRPALLRETLLVLPLAFLLAGIALAVLWLGDAVWLLAQSAIHPSGTLLVIGMCIPAFVTLRAAARLWFWWDALRQRRFLWALTHAQLTVVVLIGLLLMLVGLGVIGYMVHVELNDLASLPGIPPYSVFMQVIVWLLGLAFLTLLFISAGILLLFPVALLFSYLIARGLTRRVEDLALAAARMREGDLSTRVPVEGQDELARLQGSFNRMAEDLEQRTQELEVRSRELEARSRELRAERDRTDALLKAHRELAASVSHELRTPVATARAYIEGLLEHHAGETSSGIERDLHILSSEVSRLEHLIDDLFTLSRAEVDRLSLEIVPVEVCVLLERLVELVQKPAWEMRRVDVQYAAGAGPLVALVDPARLEQMIRNLLQNSLRHTPPGGYVMVSCELVSPDLVSSQLASSEKVDAWVRIQVEDSGEGIDPADLPHIWERFYRADSARLAGEGSGLGLALVKELAEAMGGQAGADSTPGEGSTFWLLLPACDTIAT